MLRFLIDKLREPQGPLKSARLLLGDILEEALDVSSHYLRKIRRSREEKISTSPPPPPPPPSPPLSPQPQEETPPPKKKGRAGASPSKSTKRVAKAKKATPAKRKKPQETTAIPRTIEVSEAFAAALDSSANQRKQEFKVLAILWDVRNRSNAGMSAKDLAEHGEKLGLSIRHENIRKVIKMRLSSYVDTLQGKENQASVFHYRLNDGGEEYFSETYLG